MTFYALFIYFIILIKIVFIVSKLLTRYLEHKKSEKYQETLLSLEYISEKSEFIFVFCMSILLILLFNPYNKTFVITKETRILLFLYGIIIILTANWGAFIKEPRILTEIQGILGSYRKQKTATADTGPKVVNNTYVIDPNFINDYYTKKNVYDTIDTIDTIDTKKQTAI
jgi:hypothetical protein